MGLALDIHTTLERGEETVGVNSWRTNGFLDYARFGIELGSAPFGMTIEMRCRHQEGRQVHTDWHDDKTLYTTVVDNSHLVRSC